MSDQRNDLSDIDIKELGRSYNLKINYHSASSPEVKYSGYIDTILENGVSVKTSDSCAEGHLISFSLFDNEKEILNGTGRIESIEQENEKTLNVICVFSQFSEKDKDILRKIAESNQNSINNFIDDIS